MKTEILLAERDEAHKALAESEQRYLRLLSATTDYIYTVHLRHGLVESTEHGLGCEAVTGYTSAEFSQNPFLWYRIIYLQDREAVLQQADRILQGRLKGPLKHRIVHKDGSLRWVRNTCIPHTDSNGEMVAYDGVICDITEQTLAEMARTRTEHRLSLIIRSSTDGIWDWDIKSGETYFSPKWKAILGYRDEELPNRFETWERLLHPQDREGALTHLREYLEGKRPAYDLEHRLRHKNGTYRWIRARGEVERDGKGSPARMAGSHTDITERKLATQELEQMNLKLMRREKALQRLVGRLKLEKQKAEGARREVEDAQRRLVVADKLNFARMLAEGVAHEIRNPLQTLQGGLDYLMTRFQSTDEQLQSLLVDMRDSIRRADRIVCDIAPINNGGVDCQPADLNSLLAEVLNLVRMDLVQSSVQVEWELEPALPPVCVDVDKITKVFINLTLNALHAMPGGGTLTVRTSLVLPPMEAESPSANEMNSHGNLVVAEVLDTGKGIDPVDLPHVFEPFWRSGNGTGLGLYVVRTTVEAHHGRIEVTNRLSGGVAATVILPVAKSTV